MRFELSASYSQLCVFDPSLKSPYNAWTDDHVAQGFSWRPGSVSFAIEDLSAVVIDVDLAAAQPDLGDSSSAVRLPFEAPIGGSVEVGSIMCGVEVAVPPGPCALYFLAPSNPSDPFRFIFVPGEEAEPEVLRESAFAKKQGSYLMTAEAAV